MTQIFAFRCKLQAWFNTNTWLILDAYFKTNHLACAHKRSLNVIKHTFALTAKCSAQGKQSPIVDRAKTCRCLERVYMRGITWGLSSFIIIVSNPRWHTNSLVRHNCQQHNIRNWIVGPHTFTSGSKKMIEYSQSWSYLGKNTMSSFCQLCKALAFLQLHVVMQYVTLSMSIGKSQIDWSQLLKKAIQLERDREEEGNKLMEVSGYTRKYEKTNYFWILNIFNIFSDHP